MNKGGTTFIVFIIALLMLGLIAVFAVSGFGVGQNLFTGDFGEGPRLHSDSQVEQLNDQSTSDEINAIEQDINNTQLDGLDSELDELSEDLESL